MKKGLLLMVVFAIAGATYFGSNASAESSLLMQNLNALSKNQVMPCREGADDCPDGYTCVNGECVLGGSVCYYVYFPSVDYVTLVCYNCEYINGIRGTGKTGSCLDGI